MPIFNLLKRCTALSFLWSLGLASAPYSQERPASPRPSEATPAARPATSPPVISPELLSDRRVTFRLRAPQAREVTVSGEWGGQPQALTKDEQGVWSATIGPLPPEIYGYNFTVDSSGLPIRAMPL